MSSIYENINSLYNKKGYIERYGVELWVSVVVIMIFVLAILYFHIMNNIKPIIADWDNQKCNPAVIPFAGLINKSKDTTAFEFTGQNFTGCIQSILTNITAHAFQPFYYLINMFADSFKELAGAVNGIRAQMDKMRDSIKDFSTETMSRTLNITMPLVQLIINIKDMGSKMVGVLSASLFTLMGSYLTMKSLFLFIINLIVTILIILGITTAALLIISFIPIFGSWAIPIAAVDLAIFIAILIPTLLIKIFMSDIMNLSTPNTPDIPTCFAGSTLINVMNTEGTCQKNISSVQVGDILSDHSVVTGIMQLSSEGQTMYTLDGILVSGEHKVFHSTLGCIHVKSHPESKEITHFNEPYLYCLLTSNKKIKINNTLFCDWDDIDDIVIDKLNKNCVPRGYIPEDFKNEDIHTYLDNGLHESTKIKLKNGREIKIKNIKVNDILLNGERVVGTIKIDATGLKGIISEYDLDNGIRISCTTNININNYLGGINTFNLYGNTILSETPDVYLYQLLTTTGSFNANGVMIGDYNNGLDRFL